MSSLVQKQQKEDAYLNFVNSIKSEVTRKIYQYNLGLFIEFCGIDKFEDLIGQQNQIRYHTLCIFSFLQPLLLFPAFSYFPYNDDSKN